MGVSDRAHFAWLCEALARFEAQSGRLATMRERGQPLTLWALAATRMTPPVEFLVSKLGPGDVGVSFLDKFAREPGVTRIDFNALEDVPENSCDVLMMSRASYLVADPHAFLFHSRRLIRPGGLMILDWLHGLSDAPVLDLPGRHIYDGRAHAFLTTYCDREFLAEFPAEFAAFLQHVNRPPWWANLAPPGAPVSLKERVIRLVGGGPRRQLTLDTYLETLRAELQRAGKHLIEPGLLARYFTVAFRHARYFYPSVRKFNLFLLTVLEPVAKYARPEGQATAGTASTSAGTWSPRAWERGRGMEGSR